MGAEARSLYKSGDAECLFRVSAARLPRSANKWHSVGSLTLATAPIRMGAG
jgi:hypothetical protein